MRSDCWKGRILGVAFFFWNSCLTLVENWSRRSMTMGGMSATGGFHEDLMYSFDGRWM